MAIRESQHFIVQWTAWLPGADEDTGYYFDVIIKDAADEAGASSVTYQIATADAAGNYYYDLYSFGENGLLDDGFLIVNDFDGTYQYGTHSTADTILAQFTKGNMHIVATPDIYTTQN
jgi:hypothetical protein